MNPRRLLFAAPPAALLAASLALRAVSASPSEPAGAPAQRNEVPSPCSVIVTDTVAAKACSPAQVTVTLEVSCPLRLPLNVVFVIGRHLAMEDHLNDVKAAAREVVDGLNFDDGTKVGVISLSTQERVEQDLTEQRTTALAAISRIQLDSISPFNNYYDWIGQASRMLSEARDNGDPATPVIVLYSTGCPTGFDTYCQRQVGSANRAEGDGISMMTVCNPNARPFGFPLPGNHCRWLQQMASTGFYHDLAQAARVSDDLDGLVEQGRTMTIDSLVLSELLTAPLDIVAGSALPPPDPATNGAIFRWEDLDPGTTVTATYLVTGPALTTMTLRRDGSGAELTDSRGSGSEPLVLPPRELTMPECVPPTPVPTAIPATSTPSPTATPAATPTSAPRPSTAYLPITLLNHCRPTRQRADVVLAIDASSSMLEALGTSTKLAAAQEAARSFVTASEQGADQVALVAFHESADILAPLGSTQAEVVRAVDALATHTGTRIDLALARSADALAAAGRRPTNRAVVILLTDGHTDGSRKDVLDAADMLKGAGVTVYSVGLGPDADGALLEEVASARGLYRPATDAGTLVRIYAEIVRELPCAAVAARLSR